MRELNMAECQETSGGHIQTTGDAILLAIAVAIVAGGFTIIIALPWPGDA